MDADPPTFSHSATPRLSMDGRPGAEDAGNAVQNAWVVFSGQTDMPYLKWLRPGFRHCFVILNDGRQWLSLDPLSNHMDLQAWYHLAGDFNLPDWLSARGHAVVKAPVQRHHKKPAPFMIFTCVEAVKRVLGLHKPGIFTPWQLYCYLTSQRHPAALAFLTKRRGDDTRKNVEKGDIQWEA